MRMPGCRLPMEPVSRKWALGALLLHDGHDLGGVVGHGEEVDGGDPVPILGRMLPRVPAPPTPALLKKTSI